MNAIGAFDSSRYQASTLFGQSVRDRTDARTALQAAMVLKNRVQASDSLENPIDSTDKNGAEKTGGSAENKSADFAQTLSEKKKLTWEKAQQTAGDLVSNALILPMLKQLRRGNLIKEGVFAPGIAENTFGPEFDMQIADRIAHSSKMGLTNTLAERMMNHGKPLSRVKKEDVQGRGMKGQEGGKVDVHG